MFQVVFSSFAVVVLLCTEAGFGQSTIVRERPGLASEDFAGSVPAEGGDQSLLSLSLDDAIRRGLDRNLGALLSRARVDDAKGGLKQSRSLLMPQLAAAVGESRRKVNLSVFGFPPSADRPSVVGPFDVFDARLFLEWSLFDAERWGSLRASASLVDAAELSRRDAEDLVTLVVSDAYLRTLAWRSQVASVRAQVRTSGSLADLATGRRETGLVAGIEVLRAAVQLRRDEQRLIAAENDLAKQRLVLAQAIGLPLGQRFELSDELGQREDPRLAPERALALAYAGRSDLGAAEAKVRAARLERRSAKGQRYPDLVLAGDYGRLGNARDDAEEVFDVGLGIRIPLWTGGRISGDVAESDAQLVRAEARLAELRSAIYYEVQSILLDLEATGREIEVTHSAVDLTEQQLEQARNRFAAGVADNLETVEAQEAVAIANDEWIASLYRRDLALARLDRALGGGGLEAASAPNSEGGS